MENFIKLLFINSICKCGGVSLPRQLDHVFNARRIIIDSNEDLQPFRRFGGGSFYQYDPKEVSSILGVPSMPSHLPEAEPILPGHTLLKPSLGMLKSSLKFPHKDMEDGAGVYGSIDSLGESYGRNERLLFTGFRRSPADYVMVEIMADRSVAELIRNSKIPLSDKTDALSVIPSQKPESKKPRFTLVPAVLDLNKRDRVKNEVQNIFKMLNAPALKGRVKLIYLVQNGDNARNSWNRGQSEERSYYLSGDNSYRNPSIYKILKLGIKPKPILRNLGRENELNIFGYNDNIQSMDPKLLKKIRNKQFLETKHTFNPVKYSPEALSFDEFLPEDTEMKKLRNWWFYNQDDYEPLIDEE